MPDPASSVDKTYLKQALRLAKKALGRTYPNPLVGALIVQQGHIIGQGYHQGTGLPHAEIEALRTATAPVKGATLYVNLEPCSHQGKTPPCVEAIIQAGISRMVCCTLDPNPQVCGKGLKRLRQAGIAVSVGLLAHEAELLNEAFFGFHQRQRPFIALKFAASLDGKIATYSHDSQWITNEQVRDFARKLRGHYQAILVGSNTILQDDPHLGTRTPGQPDPLRIVLDSTLRLSLKSQVLRDTNVLVVTTQRANKTKLGALQARQIPLLVCQDDQILLPALLSELTRRQIISVFVEGGGTVLGSFVDARLVDKVYAFYGPLLIGGTGAVGAIGGQGAATISQALHLTRLTYQQLGVGDSTNLLVTGYPDHD
jgi:diaminohydroxyphosphoribosylaminopyrimidine deaminase/5-amino-6-(5-phosphoribosylamino)uracil reductase